MSWDRAMVNLAALQVPGVVTNYPIDGVPGRIPSAALPALLPEFTAGTTATTDRGLAALTYDGSAWRSTFFIDHLLLWAPVSLGGGLHNLHAPLLEAATAYLVALSADGTLGNALSAPLEVISITPGVHHWGEIAYAGVRFRHRWQVTVGEGA